VPEGAKQRVVVMKLLSLVACLALLASGCTCPYSNRSYAAPATSHARAGIAADAQPQDIQTALQKYIEAN
jgi:hypothetical protein